MGAALFDHTDDLADGLLCLSKSVAMRARGCLSLAVETVGLLRIGAHGLGGDLGGH